MNKIAVFVGLAADATAKVILDKIKQTYAEFKATIRGLEIKVSELQELLDKNELEMEIVNKGNVALTERLEKLEGEFKERELALNEVIKSQQEEIKANSEAFDASYSAISEENNVLLLKLEGKESEQVELPVKNGVKLLTEEEIKDKALACFKVNPEANELFGTVDGLIFLNVKMATAHKDAIGGTVLTFNRE